MDNVRRYAFEHHARIMRELEDMGFAPTPEQKVTADHPKQPSIRAEEAVQGGMGVNTAKIRLLILERPQ